MKVLHLFEVHNAMPIYAYRCESCGHSKDVLQKISDAPLTVCPQCGAASFKKQVTAAGFRLKGAGWYATDFRGGTGDAAAPPAAAGNGDKTEAKTDAKVESKTSEGGATTAKSDAAPAKTATGPAPSGAAPAASPDR